jgi:hypothetical protein
VAAKVRNINPWQHELNLVKETVECSKGYGLATIWFPVLAEINRGIEYSLLIKVKDIIMFYHYSFSDDGYAFK